MRILVISQYYYPEQFRINDICEELVNRGHKVTVLTGLPNYPEGKILNEYRHGKKKHDIVGGVEIIRTWEIGRGHNSLSLFLNYFSFMVSGWIKAGFLPKKKFDVIFGYGPSPVMSMLGALRFKHRSKLKMIYWCLDIWPESLVGKLRNCKGAVFNICNLISHKVYHACDTILVTSKPFIDYIHYTHGIDKSRIEYLPQHAEDNYADEMLNEDNGCYDFLFAGNIGEIQNIDCIIDAVDHIKAIPDFKVHIVGDGSYLSTAKKTVNEKELDSLIEFYGYHSTEEIVNYYKIADCCLLTLKQMNLAGLTLPAKLQSYMAAGKPVIAAINGAAKDVIEESGCGICVPSGDSDNLAIAMKEFIENPLKYKNLGENGHNYFISHYTKKCVVDQIEKQLLKISKSE